ncbi:hypothetical protein [Aromatoleum aromaticum]|uniref:hypothetical protein n=1 Tax=Aromatoleum aromaticum TaxID=551760 RepID=UPI001F51EF59|nr:hypothetical protein [Aromatoleum aromaticum]
MRQYDRSRISLVVASVVLLAAVFGLRYGLLEAGAFPLDCGESLAEGLGPWCATKWLLVQSFLDQRLGWLSFACGVAAFVLRYRPLAWGGWFGGLAGLVLYSFDPSAVGALLSLLVLARSGPQRRRGEEEASEEPDRGLRVQRLG